MIFPSICPNFHGFPKFWGAVAPLPPVDTVALSHLADNLNPEIFKELEQNTHYVNTTAQNTHYVNTTAEVTAECKSICNDDHIDTTKTLAGLHTYLIWACGLPLFLKM